MKDAWMQAVVSRWMTMYDWHFHPYGSKFNLQLSPGKLCKPDENMGVVYYCAGCSIPKEWMYSKVCGKQEEVEDFLYKRLKHKGLYKFLRPKKKHKVSWWTNPSHWHGFDMGFILDYYIHSLPRSTSLNRMVLNDKWTIRQSLVANEEIPVSSWLYVNKYLAEVYKELFEHPIEVDPYSLRKDRIQVIRDKVREKMEAARAEQQASENTSGRQQEGRVQV
jgi:hypothetical protein